MKTTQRALVLLATLIGGLATFAAVFASCLLWDCYVGDHDGQAGLGYFVLAVLAAPIGMVTSGVLAGKYFSRMNEQLTVAR